MQFAQLAVLVFLVHAVTVVVGLDDYCKFACQDPSQKHTVCHTKCKSKPKTKLVPTTFEFRQRMLNRHNELRQTIASGHDTRGGNQKAADMMALSYDMELEFIVSCWLSTLAVIEHDHCRGVARWPVVGQNLFMVTLPASYGPPDGEKMVKMGIEGYYEEIQLVKKNDLTNFSIPTDRRIGHFTQLLWSTTAYLGCASVLVDNGKTSPMLLQGCNYAPGGNYRTRKVYEFGDPASKCPAGLTKSTKYDALCGEVRPFEPEARKTGNWMLDEFLKQSEKSEKSKKSKKSGCPGLNKLTLKLGGVLFVVFLLTFN